jgi:hypothetical protein
MVGVRLRDGSWWGGGDDVQKNSKHSFLVTFSNADHSFSLVLL